MVAAGYGQKQSPGAAEPVEVIEANPRKLGKGDREQSEIDAADLVAEGEGADGGAEQCADSHRQPNARPGTEAEMKVKRGGGVSADAEIKRMAQRQLAGEAHHDVPRLAGVGEEQKKRGDR